MNLKSVIKLKTLTFLLAVGVASATVAFAQDASNDLKLHWFNAFYSAQDAIPRQHLFILLTDVMDAKYNDNIKPLVFPKDTDWNGKSAITREQLFDGVLKNFSSLLFQRATPKTFSDVPATYPGFTALDWFFRSGLNPTAWGDGKTIALYRPVTYEEALQFASALKDLSLAERPHFALSYGPAPPPPSATQFFELSLKRDQPNVLLELRWKGDPAQKPETLQLNLASWGLLSDVTLYDDGTYGDQKENDGTFGTWISSNAVPAQNSYVDVGFRLVDQQEVVGRLNLP